MRTLTRRSLATLLAMLALCVAAPLTASAAAASAATDKPLKIGIIGTGRIGGALARHWVAAGHEVFVSSRHPEELKSLVDELGPRAHAGTPKEAAAFGEVILVSVPYGAMQQLGVDLQAELKDKIILDTSNPVERRDGPMAAEVLKKGVGLSTAEYLHSKRVVRAFNCIPAATLANQGNRQPARIAVPIGGDDAAAIKVAERLVRDAGFDPVLVGSLADTSRFELGKPLATGELSAGEYTAKMKATP
jgi:8-hydroxy-5-deazaflavin:NADPH oxidoreductase